MFRPLQKLAMQKVSPDDGFNCRKHIGIAVKREMFYNKVVLMTR